MIFFDFFHKTRRKIEKYRQNGILASSLLFAGSIQICCQRQGRERRTGALGDCGTPFMEKIRQPPSIYI